MKVVRVWMAMGVALLLAAAGGCAVQQEEPALEQMSPLEQELTRRNLEVGESVDRISNYSFTSWSYVDNQHVLVTVGVSDYYLITLGQPCQGLSRTENVQFATVGPDLTTLDQLIVDQERCQIGTIEKLEPVAEEEEARD